MKNLNLEQMEQTQACGWGSCLWSVGMMAFGAAAVGATGGIGLPFLISSMSFFVSSASAGSACSDVF